MTGQGPKVNLEHQANAGILRYLRNKAPTSKSLRARGAAQTSSISIRAAPNASSEPAPRRRELSTAASVLNTRALNCKLFKAMAGRITAISSRISNP